MTTGTVNREQEATLITQICSGEKNLFHTLVKPYQRMVYATALSVLGNATDVEDVAQEAFLKAFRNLSRFRGEARFSTWLVQIALNEARFVLRKRRPQMFESLDADDGADRGDYVPRDFADWREIPSEALARTELRLALQTAVAALKPIYREVLVLRDVEGLSVAESAAALGVSVAVVKTRLLRARLRVRDALAPGFDGSWMSGRQEYQRVRPW